MENQVTVEKEKLSTKELVIKILKIAGNVVFYAIIVCLLLFSIMNIRGSKDNASYPNIFGRGMLAVVSDSMNGDEEDSFDIGDLLIVKTFDEEDFDDLEIGDVVTFYDPDAGKGKGGLNSHRIVHITVNEKGERESIVVQGDLSVKSRNYTFNPNDMEHAYLNGELVSSGEVDYLQADDVLGVMVKIRRGAGNALLSLQKPVVWFFVFVLPVLLFLLFEIFIVVKNVLDLKNQKQKEELQKSNEELKADLEAQKEALRAEILAELKKESEEKNTEE